MAIIQISRKRKRIILFYAEAYPVNYDARVGYMEEFIELFINYLSVERGLSSNTLSAYRSDLAEYLSYLGAHSFLALSRTTKNEIVGFMISQKERGIAANSIARRLAAIRMFYRFLVRERILRRIRRILSIPRSFGRRSRKPCLCRR